MERAYFPPQHGKGLNLHGCLWNLWCEVGVRGGGGGGGAGGGGGGWGGGGGGQKGRGIGKFLPRPPPPHLTP